MILSLTGCAVAPRKEKLPVAAAPIKEVAVRWEHHQAQVKKLTHWKAQGRLAASNGKDGGNASFQWEQRGEHYQIKLWGPFGAGAVYLNGGPNRVQAQQANGKTVVAKTPEELLKKIAGWTVPISGMRYWMLGLPSPNSEIRSQHFDNEGMLLNLRQENWNVEYEAYGIYKMASLPNKLQLKNGNIKVKILLTSWEK